MPTGPYSAEQVCIDLFTAGFLWFVLSTILNRWLFERATSDRRRFVVMPLAVLLNVGTMAGVIPYLVSPTSHEMTIPGACVGVFFGAAFGLMLSGHRRGHSEARRLDSL